MACRLMALDKRPGVRHVGIGETLCWALAKLVMRAAGYQGKTVCGNLQLCIGLEAGIEVATHAVGQRRIERVGARWRVEKEAESSNKEEESGNVAEVLGNLRIYMAVTEEEAAEQL